MQNTMASSWPEMSREDEKSLRQLADLLHLFHFRNKNQHRHSLWWRSFSMFRQQLNHLLNDICLLTDAPTTHLARARKKSQDAKYRTNIQQRMNFWQETLLTRWQHSFSQLVADGRFAVLGVVLIAVLTQVCAITGLTANLEELGQANVEKLLEEFAKEDWGLRPQPSESTRFEDLGQIIARGPLVQDQPLATVGRVAPLAQDELLFNVQAPVQTQRWEESRSQKRQAKKRKKGDAIDQLFGALV
jgi:hypothetical protein